MTTPTSLLLVDDQTSIRALLFTALTRAGYRVTTAADGDEALESASRSAPSLILMDLMMPRLDGWQTISRLKADPATRDIPVIAITANHQVTAEQLREAGFSCHLRKPFRLEPVITAVERCLQAAAAGESWADLPPDGG